MSKLRKSAQIPPGTRDLRSLTIFAALLCSVAFVAGLVMFFFADRQSKALGLVPGDVFWGKAGFQVFLIGAIGPFVFWSAHSGLALWVDHAGKWFGGNWGRGANTAGSAASPCFRAAAPGRGVSWVRVP